MTNFPGNGGFLPSQLAFTTVPSTITSGSPFSVTVQAQQFDGTPAAVSGNTNISLTKTGAGTLGGTTTGTISAGSNSITISGVTYTNANGEDGVTLTASRTSGDTLTAGTSTPFTVLGTPSQLVFTPSPSTPTAPNTAFTTQPKVNEEDNAGHVITSDSSSQVKLSADPGDDPGGAALSCTTNPVTLSSGVATFGGCKVDLPGTNYTLTAATPPTSPTITGTSNAFSITGDTWLGNTSSAWETGSNWSTGSAPTNTVDAFIPAGRPNNPIASVTGDAAKTITMSGSSGGPPSLTVSGGTLTVASSVTVNAGTLTVSGGSLDPGSVGLTNSSTVNVSGTGIVTGAPPVTNSSAGTMSFSSSGTSSLGAVDNSGTLTVSAGGVNASTVTESGATTTVSGGTLTPSGSTTNNGTFTVSGTGALSGNKAFTNNTGAVATFSSSGSSTINALTNNSSASPFGFTVSNGTLTLGSAPTNTGSINVSGGTLSATSGDFNTAGSVTVSGGTLDLGTHNFNGTTAVTVSGGTLSVHDLASGPLTLSGGLVQISHDFKPASFSGATGGTVEWNGTSSAGAFPGGTYNFFNVQIDSGADPGFNNTTTNQINVAGRWTFVGTPAGSFGISANKTWTAGALFFDSTQQASGTWGHQSNAAHVDTTHFPQNTNGLLNVASSAATRLVITGSATQTAGTSQNLTITAKDANGNTAVSYTGDKTLTFSGANSINGNIPTVTDKTGTATNFGTGTTITFVNGVATAAGVNGSMTLDKAEAATIAATDGTISTTWSSRRHAVGNGERRGGVEDRLVGLECRPPVCHVPHVHGDDRGHVREHGDDGRRQHRQRQLQPEWNRVGDRHGLDPRSRRRGDEEHHRQSGRFDHPRRERHAQRPGLDELEPGQLQRRPGHRDASQVRRAAE